MEEKHYYHAATKGLESDVLFANKEQFIAGMNRVAFVSLSFPNVIVIAFCLMDNHIHLILWGTRDDCMSFMSMYKHMTEVWLSHHDPKSKGKDWDFDCWRIANVEKFMETVCYVFRNPVAAGMNIQPSCYRWSTCNLMFSTDEVPAGCIELDGMSVYKRRKLLSTTQELPGRWLLEEDGMIWPGSYVNYKDAMTKFRTVGNFLYELSRRNEDVINAEMYNDRVSLPDRDVINIAISLSEKLFGTSDLMLLTPDQRFSVCAELRSKYNCNIKQVSRVLHISLKDLKSVYHIGDRLSK